MHTNYFKLQDRLIFLGEESGSQRVRESARLAILWGQRGEGNP